MFLKALNPNKGTFLRIFLLFREINLKRYEIDNGFKTMQSILYDLKINYFLFIKLPFRSNIGINRWMFRVSL